MRSFVLFWLLLISAGIKGEPTAAAEKPLETLHHQAIPRGLPRLPASEKNPLTEAKIALGRRLFFDAQLSADGSVSCATCHQPEHGWSDPTRVAVGISGQKGRRRTQSLFNVAWQQNLFWDGRSPSLEEQSLAPLMNAIEMGEQTLIDIAARLAAKPEYVRLFSTAFNGKPSPRRIGQAIASFERTILAGDAPLDRFQAGDTDAMSASAQRGLKLFYGRAHCGACHAGQLFTDRAFHNIGVGIKDGNVDPGRQTVSRLEGDRGAFRTPGLRNVATHPPYMHDGSLPTLEAVIDFYDAGGNQNDQLDEEIFPLRLNDRDKRDLRTFLLEGLTSFSARKHISDRESVSNLK